MFDEKLVLQIAKEMGIPATEGTGRTFVNDQPSTYIKELEVELNQKKERNTASTVDMPQHTEVTYPVQSETNDIRNQKVETSQSHAQESFKEVEIMTFGIVAA